MVEEMYKKAIENNSDIVLCNYYEIYENKKIEKKPWKEYSKDVSVNYILFNPSLWNKLIKTKVIRDNNIKFLENHIYEDLATIPILGGCTTKISYIEKPLYNYIIRENSTMRQPVYNKKLDSIFVAIDHLEEQFKSRNLLEKYYSEIEYLNIYHLLYAASGRFLEYKGGINKLKNIKKIIKETYPEWRKNKYYKKQNLIFKISCNIFYSNNLIIINIYKMARKIMKLK